MELSTGPNILLEQLLPIRPERGVVQLHEVHVQGPLFVDKPVERVCANLVPEDAQPLSGNRQPGLVKCVEEFVHVFALLARWLVGLVRFHPFPGEQPLDVGSGRKVNLCADALEGKAVDRPHTFGKRRAVGHVRLKGFHVRAEYRYGQEHLGHFGARVLEVSPDRNRPNHGTGTLN